MKKLMLFMTVLFMAVMTLPTTTFAQEKAAEKVVLKDGDKCIDFTFKDINGKEVSLSDLKGKYILIDVWATWCSPCRNEIPFLKKLEEKMHGKKIEFVSISCDKDKAAWEKMVKDEKLGGIQLFSDGDKTFMEAFGITGIPRFIMLDKKGNILKTKMIRPSKEEEIYTYLMGLKGI